jgi:outer membrane protein TolC
LQARSDLATEASKAEFARFQLAVVESALQAQKTYYDLYVVMERLRVTEKNLALVRDFEEAARRRSEAGRADLRDVLQAENEAARLENDAANLHDQKNAIAAAWKSDLGIPPGEPDPPIPGLFFFSDDRLTSEAAFADVMTSNPRLRILQTEIQRAEAGLAIAYKTKTPDFSAGIEVEAPTTRGSGNPRDTIWKPRLGTTLPIWRDRIAAEIAEAESMKWPRARNTASNRLRSLGNLPSTPFGIRENLAQSRCPSQGTSPPPA